MDHSPGSSSPKSRKHIMGHNSDELDELLASFDPVTHKLIDMGDNVMGLMPDMAKSGDQLIHDSPLRKETHAYSPAILDNILKNDSRNCMDNLCSQFTLYISIYLVSKKKLLVFR